MCSDPGYFVRSMDYSASEFSDLLEYSLQRFDLMRINNRLVERFGHKSTVDAGFGL